MKFGPDRLQLPGLRGDFFLQRLALGGEARRFFRSLRAEILLLLDVPDFLREFLPRIFEIGGNAVALPGDGREFFVAAFRERLELRLDGIEIAGLRGQFVLQRLALDCEVGSFFRALRADASVKINLPGFRGQFLPRSREFGLQRVVLLRERCGFFAAAFFQRGDFFGERRELRVPGRDFLLQRLALRDRRAGFLRLRRAEQFVLLDVADLCFEFGFRAFEFRHGAVALRGDGLALGGQRLGLPLKFRLGFREF